MCANGPRSKQLDQAAFEVRLLGDAMDSVVFVLLLGIIALLPLRCGVLKQYGKTAIAIAIAVGLTFMVVPCAGPMGACGLVVDHICGDLYPGETNVVYLRAFGWTACVLDTVTARLGAISAASAAR